MQEHIGRAGRRSAIHFGDQAVLHQIDRQREHHAARPRPPAPIARARRAGTGSRCRDGSTAGRLQAARGSSRRATSAKRRRRARRSSRPSATAKYSPVLQMSRGVPVANDIAMPRESEKDQSAGQDRRARPDQTGPPVRPRVFHFAAQNQAGTNMPDPDQGRQGEEQRRQNRDADALRGRQEVPVRGRLELKVPRQERPGKRAAPRARTPRPANRPPARAAMVWSR